MQPSTVNAAQLSVAEALVLQEPNKAQGRAALKLTMMDLLARRVLTLYQAERKGKLGMTRKSEHLKLDSNAAARFAQQPHVQAVINAIASPVTNGADPTMQQVVAGARKVFGNDLARFQSNFVLPRLVERGLLQVTKKKVLFIFSTTRYEHTPEGQAVLQQIQVQMAQARRIPSMLEGSSPAELAALVVGLGGALLLVDELRPHYGRLSQVLRTGGASDGDGGFAGTDSHMPDTDEDNPELQELSPELSSDFDAVDFGGSNLGGFDLDAFDSLDSSLDAFDSSFDSSADSGGSDGGDSGGGGGD